MAIAADLPPELAQGLLVNPEKFDVAIRFAQGPGETLGNRVSPHRGMAIKVFGVEGAKLPGHDAPAPCTVWHSLPKGSSRSSRIARACLPSGMARMGRNAARPLLRR